LQVAATPMAGMKVIPQWTDRKLYMRARRL